MTHHLALPLRLSADGRLQALTDGAPAEIAQSVQVLLATRVGERRSEPFYGSAEALFTPVEAGRAAPVDTGAIARWEPRADGVVTVTATSSW